MNNETKVGIFVVIIFAAFILMSINIGEMDLKRQRTYPIHMNFNSVEGLKVGSPLEVAGVIVGRVTGIELTGRRLVRVSADINSDINLPIDSEAMIASKGVLGDKMVILYPGSSDELIKTDGEINRTASPTSMDAIFSQLGSVSESLTELTASLNSLISDGDTMTDLREIVVNLKDITASASVLAQQNAANISALLINLNTSLENISRLTASITETGEHLNIISGAVASGEGTLGKLLTDDGMYVSLNQIISRIDTMSALLEQENNLSLLLSDSSVYYNLAAVTENLKLLSELTAGGQGTLGHNLADEELHRLLVETQRNANNAAQGLEEQTPISVMGTVMGLVW